SSRRRYTSFSRDWSSAVCSSDLVQRRGGPPARQGRAAAIHRRAEEAIPATTVRRPLMSFFDLLRDRDRKQTASIAKERLQIIVAHERVQRVQPDYLPALHKELIAVVRKYVKIGRAHV